MPLDIEILWLQPIKVNLNVHFGVLYHYIFFKILVQEDISTFMTLSCAISVEARAQEHGF